MNGNKRQFVDGDAGIAGGINWRVIKGNKFIGDLVIQWYVNERWIPVSLDTIFVAVDLICQNEDARYPYPADGGQRVIRAIGNARLRGYEYATGHLHLERQNRAEKDRQRWLA